MSVGRGNRNVRTKSYRHCLRTIDKKIQDLADLAFAEFLRDPESPALENHPLEDTRRGQHRQGSRAVSVTLRYRAIYVVDGDTNVWYWIGSHESYNNFTGKK
jgi:hypothetical protein